MTSTTVTATPDTLNSIMEFDHVIYSDGEGNITHLPNVYAPCADFHESYTDGAQLDCSSWGLVTGYSHQDRYVGPIMHSSELIGGGLALMILETPGIYVAITVEDHEDPENPAGWAIAQRDTVPNIESMIPRSHLAAETPRTYVIDEATFVKLRLPNHSEVTAHCVQVTPLRSEVAFDLYAAQHDSHHYGMTAEHAATFIDRQSNATADGTAIAQAMTEASAAMRRAAQLTASAAGPWK